jgi:hypothetical protein
MGKIKIIISFFIIFVFYLSLEKPVFSQTANSSGSSAILKNSLIEKDNREDILKNFLIKYNSPLVPYAKDFIKAADFYEVDWKLLPAIAGVESSFGKRIPKDSFNAYGWNNGKFKFSSWEDSIWYVNSQLKFNYLNRGKKSISQIAKIYAPPSNSWAGKVNFFIREIEKQSNLLPNF